MANLFVIGELNSRTLVLTFEMNRIYDVIKKYLVVTQKQRDAVPFLAAKFLTRPENEKVYLQDFVEWSLPLIKPAADKSQESELIKGICMSYHYIVKLGKREIILPYAPRILHSIIQADLQSSKDDQMVKYVVKLSQRIGLCFMKSRNVSWRYSRGKRVLADNFAGLKQSGDMMDVLNEDFDVPQELEEVIQILLNGLKNPSTRIRWPAAKGIGRITNRLPKEMSEMVMESALELCSHRESDAAWHGTCLTMAEMGRRGLILPSRLAEVFQVVKKALLYDEHKGCYSVGSNVRDAACYVCWAFGRAYDADTLKPFVEDMASSLLMVCVFDREVNCRQAAAAAFQENVGRQGSFPNGIEIVTTVDYHSVGSRRNSFINLSRYLSQFSEYREPLIQHLLQRKINHWDPQIRQLASEALHHLCSPLDVDFVREHVLPPLMKFSSQVDIDSRHGSLLALAEMLLLFKEKEEAVDGPIKDLIQNLIFCL